MTQIENLSTGEIKGNGDTLEGTLDGNGNILDGKFDGTVVVLVPTLWGVGLRKKGTPADVIEAILDEPFTIKLSGTIYVSRPEQNYSGPAPYDQAR